MRRLNPITETPQTLAQPAVLAVTGGAGQAWLNAPTIPHIQTAAEIALPSISGFEILRELGRGGMGVVYQARQLDTDTIVAIKVLLAGNHASQIERERFRREMMAASVIRHPNVIQLLSAGEQNGLPYLVLEYVEGGSLADRLDGKPWTPTDAVQLVQLLATTVQFAHEQGVLHRDLKPANILFAGETPKLADFGLAKSVEGESSSRPVTESGAVLGTPSYISPEQAMGENPLTPATDVYSLGAILYELLTGRPPFDGKNTLDIVLKVLKEAPIAPSRFVSELPCDLEAIILKCLHKDPQKRYATAAELAQDLQRFLLGEATLAQPLSVTRRLFTWFLSRPRISALGTSTAMLILAFCAWWGQSHRTTESPTAVAPSQQLNPVATTHTVTTPGRIPFSEYRKIAGAKDAKVLELLEQYEELRQRLQALREKSEPAVKTEKHHPICLPEKATDTDGDQTEPENRPLRRGLIPFLWLMPRRG